MKANYGAKISLGGKELPLSPREEKIAKIVWEEAQRQFDAGQKALTTAICQYVMYGVHKRYGKGGKALTSLYKEIIENLASLKYDLRDGKEYTIGNNTEDFAYKIELRKIGFDIDKIDQSIIYDPETGSVTWKEE